MIPSRSAALERVFHLLIFFRGSFIESLIESEDHIFTKVNIEKKDRKEESQAFQERNFFFGKISSKAKRSK